MTLEPQPVPTGATRRLRPLVPADRNALHAIASDPSTRQPHPERRETAAA